MIPNIYFVGRAGAGKSYSCEYIKKVYGSLQAKFANPVYMIAEKYFNMVGKDRNLLQYIGTEVARKYIDNNIWVDRLIEDLEIVQRTALELYNKEVSFVSDDVRFPNEHEALRDAGWVGIYLNTPEDIRIKRLTTRDGSAQVETLNHVSETASDAFKHELIHVDSSGTLEETYSQINIIISQVR